MTALDIDVFETRVIELVRAYDTLKSDYATLERAYVAEQQRTDEVRKRLGRVIERIRSLESESRLAAHDLGAPRSSGDDAS